MANAASYQICGVGDNMVRNYCHPCREKVTVAMAPLQRSTSVMELCNLF